MKKFINLKSLDVKIFTDDVDSEVLEQIQQVAKSSVGENAHIRIMPDVHLGKGCCIGTTMKVIDKVCPNLVGVDIGCGVDLVKTNLDFKQMFDSLDNVIRNCVPHGLNVHKDKKDYAFDSLRCFDKLDGDVKERASKSLGSLGGGNHFIEAYENGYLAVHSGSRNIGNVVASYYQKLAMKNCKQEYDRQTRAVIAMTKPSQREAVATKRKENFEFDIAYLTGTQMQDYLFDVDLMQKFAVANRQEMLKTIVEKLGGVITEKITSIHNYIEIETMILRKGAISAKKDEVLVIPLNMSEGLLLCKGKGNADWNCSAPHGAGRLYSRSKARQVLKMEEYKDSMKGIYTTCINKNTLDESPMAYKDSDSIINFIKPTVEVIARLKPIYNFKAN